MIKKADLDAFSRRHQSKATMERHLQVIDPQLRDVMASREENSPMDSPRERAGL